MAPRPAPVALDLDRLLAGTGTGIIVCCGSGGVGKTTTAAALGVAAAEAGRRVVVLTIDPARRLAQSLGLTELDNTPRPVPGVGTEAGGSLDAMMLDMKRTFDDVVLAHSTPEKAAQILENPFYQAVSSSFAGTQEYMAMERLASCGPRPSATARGTSSSSTPRRPARPWTSSTPRSGSGPSSTAASSASSWRRPAPAAGPTSRCSRSAPTSPPPPCRRCSAASSSPTCRPSSPPSTRCSAASASGPTSPTPLLKDPSTAFVVVAAPERDALREAAYFVERLEAEGMPLAGVVVNRMQRLGRRGSAGRGPPRRPSSSRTATTPGRTTPTPALLRLHAALAEVATRHEGRVSRFVASHPGVPVSTVPAGATDIHDLDGLREVGSALAS